MTMKPICIECQTEFRVKKQGVTVRTMFGNPPQPYQLYKADLLQCPGCGTRTIYGFGSQPYAEHFQPDFAEKLKRDGFYDCFDVYERPEVEQTHAS